MYRTPILVAILACVSSCQKPEVIDVCSKDRAMAERCRANQELVYYDSFRNLLCLDGTIDTNGEMFRSIKAKNVRTGVLVSMNSGGGSVRSSLEIVDYLIRRKYEVIIIDKCLSSCAQFIFLGAHRRLIEKGATVAMHGYPFLDSELEDMKLSPADLKIIQDVNNKFRRFFVERHVSINIISKQVGDTGNVISLSGTQFWQPSERDYASKGILVKYCD